MINHGFSRGLFVRCFMWYLGMCGACGCIESVKVRVCTEGNLLEESAGAWRV